MELNFQKSTIRENGGLLSSHNPCSRQLASVSLTYLWAVEPFRVPLFVQGLGLFLVGKRYRMETWRGREGEDCYRRAHHHLRAAPSQYLCRFLTRTEEFLPAIKPTSNLQYPCNSFRLQVGLTYNIYDAEKPGVCRMP